MAEIDETDLLFIHSLHTRDRLLEELAKFAPSVTRYIVLGGTAGNGSRGEDGGPGLVDAIKAFIAANPDWFIAAHTNEQYGLTVPGPAAGRSARREDPSSGRWAMGPERN